MPAPKLRDQLARLIELEHHVERRHLSRRRVPAVFAPQRSATQMNLPSGETSTALVDPQVRPSGSLKYPSIVWYGFGKSLVGVRRRLREERGAGKRHRRGQALPGSH